MKKPSRKLTLKNIALFVVFGIFTTALIFQSQGRLDAKEILEFNRDPKNYNAKLQIFDDEKIVAEFFVAIADSKYKKMYGLMNLEKLPQNHGMLFLFSRSEVVLMWMKNTLIPLDMIFIDKNNIIASIKTNATVQSLETISSQKEVNKVLEINAGLVEKLGIKVGQKIVE